MQHYIYQIEKSHVRTKNSVKATQFPFGHMGTKVYHILWPFKIVLCHVLANSFPQQTPTLSLAWSRVVDPTMDVSPIFTLLFFLSTIY